MRRKHILNDQQFKDRLDLKEAEFLFLYHDSCILTDSEDADHRLGIIEK